MRTIAAFALAALASLTACAHVPAPEARQLEVAADGRHFERGGQPFFWLGDTAWELFHRTTPEEAALYLDDRAEKGFTVVQAVLLAELGGLRVPTPNGHLPLEGNDPTRPNEAYFGYVDKVVDMAAERGIVMALLPTWGDKFNKKWGEGPEIFTPENARVYGEWLGRRYRGKPVVWLLGGDRNPETPAHFAIVRAMAEGIDAGTGGSQLISYHPQGFAQSWQFFRDDPWIAFHLFQSGHDHIDLHNQRWTLEGRALTPVKPVLDGEPRYEGHPAALYRLQDKWDGRWFDQYDVRQAAWWSVLSGAAGHTYGNHNIWQMWQPPREPTSKARTPWKQALEHPGAAQMGLMRRLLERNGFGTLQPAQELLAENEDGAGHRVAARAADGTIIVYTPLGLPVRLRAQGDGRWFDPRTGREQPAAAAAGVFDPPGEPGRGNDWVLVVKPR